MPADLAVIIVSWNTRVLTLDGLRTLCQDLDANGPSADIWVVDNASSDGSAEAIQAHFPAVHLLRTESNVGFAAGNNLALRQLGFSDQPGTALQTNCPRAVYLLNPDTRTHPGATRLLYDALFTLPRAGVVGAQLEYADGSFQHGAFMFPGLLQLIIDLFPVPARLTETRLNGRYPRARYHVGVPFRVGHTLGASMMLRAEAIAQTGLFDEQYFMYCEEIDWSLRIRRAGWEIYTIPAARVTHLAGQSTGQIRPQSFINLWRSRLRLYTKHHSPVTRALARLIVRLGMHWQIWRARRAHTAGTLSSEECHALVEAYRSVGRLWK